MKNEHYGSVVLSPTSLFGVVAKRPRQMRGRYPCLAFLVAVIWLLPNQAIAQQAQLSGVVRDEQRAAIVGAELRLLEDETGLVQSTRTNDRGLYLFASVRPGVYQLDVTAGGFGAFRQKALQLNVEQRAVLDVTLMVESVKVEVRVSADRPLLGMADGSLGTVIDRRLAEALPVRGRSFTALMTLVPGVTTLAGGASASDGSEFRVNAQRSSSNSLLVDGVSAPSEMGSSLRLGGDGQRFARTATGGINGGLSLDAVQEFRVQTSTFAPEFGRTPGAQISLVTRSGSNRSTGSLFEQFRDDRMVANEWFAKRRGIAKPSIEEHQFGVAAGGPMIRGRLFYFASYEGLRLRQPSFVNQNVPSLAAREADSMIRDVLKLYPTPTGPARDNGTAEHAAYYPIRYVSDTLGVRVDHAISGATVIFGRYSQVASAQKDQNPFNIDAEVARDARNVTVGLTSPLRSNLLIEARANYSEGLSNPSNMSPLRNWFPSEVPSTGSLTFGITGLPSLWAGDRSNTKVRQVNSIASLSHLRGAHNMKIGMDHRLVLPIDAGTYTLTTQFPALNQALVATSASVLNVTNRFAVQATIQNISLYAQDTWKIRPRLSATYGVRWDVNPAPSFAKDQGPLAVETFEPVTALKLYTRRGEPLWRTDHKGFFPRLGISYALDDEGHTVLSGGVGLFGDLTASAAGGAASLSAGAQTQLNRTNVRLPFTAADVVGIPEARLTPPYAGTNVAVDPSLATPRTSQWNVTLQKNIAKSHELSASYVGAYGTRLLVSRQFAPGLTPDFTGNVYVVTGSGRSRYAAMQLRYRGRHYGGIETLSSYTYGSAMDTAAGLFTIDLTNRLAPTNTDLRHTFNLAMSWSVPDRATGRMKWLWKDWGLHLLAAARSGYPFSITTSNFITAPGGEIVFVRFASLVPDVPITLGDPNAPGGRRYNRLAFTDPPPNQQGNTGRNAFRGFGAAQLDAGLQRVFPLPRGLKARVRTDVFNVLNTPMFQDPSGSLASSTFGVSNGSLATGIAALYRAGGPRTAVISLRMEY